METLLTSLITLFHFFPLFAKTLSSVESPSSSFSPISLHDYQQEQILLPERPSDFLVGDFSFGFQYTRFVRCIFVVYKVSFLDSGTNCFFWKSGLCLNNQEIGKLLTSLQILIILQICRIIMGVWSFVLKGESLLNYFKLFAGVCFGGLKG